MLSIYPKRIQSREEKEMCFSVGDLGWIIEVLLS